MSLAVSRRSSNANASSTMLVLLRQVRDIGIEGGIVKKLAFIDVKLRPASRTSRLIETGAGPLASPAPT